MERQELGRIINLTQHIGTPEQGCEELEENLRKEVLGLITFDEIPSNEEMCSRAERIAKIASIHGADVAMIGGAPYFQRPLEEALLFVDIEPVYAFSKRESVDTVQPDGSVRKISVFKHIGFVRPYA
jgi:hypothetical protein